MVREGVVAVHVDPADLRTIAWACRGCRHELVRGAGDRRAEAERGAAQRAQRERDARQLQEALEAIGMLPTDIAAALRAEAARGPYPFPLRPETPLYKMRLAAAVRRFKAGLPDLTTGS